MVSHQTGSLLYLVSHRELFSAPKLLFSLHINDVTADILKEGSLLMTVLAIVKLRTKRIH